MINVLVVHHNTPNMMEHLLMSLDLYVPEYHAYIFDNSNQKPYTNPNNRSNITYFDNTKGQIIDFNSEWEKYPGRLPAIVSPYHCLSVDKCMDLIDDNFILLDSDVLLKKDISELWDETQIFVGEIQESHPGGWPAPQIRVLPFVCFINNKKCKELGIRYFDPNHMLQLYPDSDPRGRLFDTGAAFYRYIKIFDLPYKEILHQDYVAHYGAASYRGSAATVQLKHGGLAFRDWLSYHRDKYEILPKKKKVVFTCITNRHDPCVITPSFLNPDWDYICFCDDPKYGPYHSWPSAVWQYAPIPDNIKDLSPAKQARWIKLHPHILFPDYEESLWVDGNAEIIGDINELVSQEGITFIRHPYRDCTYREQLSIWKDKKDSPLHTIPQTLKYLEGGLPYNYGLPETGYIYRKHHDPKCIEFMECWWKEILNGSYRDQLSVMWAVYKINPPIRWVGAEQVANIVKIID